MRADSVDSGANLMFLHFMLQTGLDPAAVNLQSELNDDSNSKVAS